jgi:hypothetical protein
MSGGDLFPVEVTLRNPLDRSDIITYIIRPEDNQLARDWQQALIDLLQRGLHLEKNFCFLGFPLNARDVPYLCDQLNRHIDQINVFNHTNCWQQQGLEPYFIEEYFCENSVRYDDDLRLGKKRLQIKHGLMNRLHNHFEILQGRVWQISDYYKHADPNTRYAIRQLNNICHELESLLLSQRKFITDPYWVRPSQITTWFDAPRHTLTDEHRQGFLSNRYDRVFGGVYMHWTQIGKTLYEVFRDEGSPKLNVGHDATDISVGSGATCEAITALKFYSGEFDVEWGRDVVQGGSHPWHDQEQQRFQSWIRDNGLDFDDTRLSLGYLKIGQVDIEQSFPGMTVDEIWNLMGRHLDIYKIQINDISATYDYCWSDHDHEAKQITALG